MMRRRQATCIIALSLLLFIYGVYALLVVKPTFNETRSTRTVISGRWAGAHDTRSQVRQPVTNSAREEELAMPRQNDVHICSTALNASHPLPKQQYKLMIIVAETSDRIGRAGENCFCSFARSMNIAACSKQPGTTGVRLCNMVVMKPSCSCLAIATPPSARARCFVTHQHDIRQLPNLHPGLLIISQCGVLPLISAARLHAFWRSLVSAL